MSGILGRKIGMTQVFADDGRIIPVTVIDSSSCSVLQVKTKDKDGYNAIQLGLTDTKGKKVKRPRFVREVAVARPEDYKVGQHIDATIFSPGEFVDIAGTSIGRGFQGGVKRWHWHGGPDSHGSMSHRAPGSIGASAFPSRVYKGHHLPGHMGRRRVTTQNLELFQVDKENSLLVVKGSVPGHKNSYLIIKKSKKKKAKEVKKEIKEEAPKK